MMSFSGVSVKRQAGLLPGLELPRGLALEAEVNWHREFHELIDDFDEKKLARRQKAALKAAGVKPQS